MEQGSWGRRSRDHLRKNAGPEVRVVKHDTDQYGRIVAEVFSRGENLNLAMARKGWAAEYDDFCSDRAYRKAENTAKAAGNGAYSEPGLHQTPWMWRRRK